jgi:RNA polymerase sigma factor (sigma-70 family)
MESGRTSVTSKQLQTILNNGTVAGLSDAQLLERFASRRDQAAEDAFSAMMSRHGPMVLSVCRSLLRDPHEAEDAFQATFIVLARKARSNRAPESLGPWLYGVAYKTALLALDRRCRRLARERRARRPEAIENAGKHDQHVMRREEAEALHAEIARLPEKYRVPVVLCYFEGLTHAQAACQMRCPEKTVGVRLMRARERLRARLTRRGLATGAGVLATGLAPSAGSANMWRWPRWSRRRSRRSPGECSRSCSSRK